MLFNSTLYLVFLAAVVSIYYLLTPRYRRYLLLLASYTFYWVWSIPFSLLLFASTIVAYAAANVIGTRSSKGQRQLALITSLLLNLGTLALFKYADFFSDSAYSLCGVRPWPQLNWVLPLGISFYTFQTISYIVDVYRGLMTPRKSLLDVAIFVSFFPQLVAGPIVRAEQLFPQLAMENQGVDWPQIRRGLALIIWGMAKKVFVADSMGRLANLAYDSPQLYSAGDLVLATYAFAVQIYCDFSGYSDIAIGTALLLGIRLPDNFHAPYLSCSLRDFWRRWHITLSTCLRDYLYIPLGGSRHGSIRTYGNLMTTMLLGGLWHGAGWNWVVWGAIHGGILSAERAIGLSNRPRNSFTATLRWLITFHIVCVSWVFFRAAGVGEAWAILERITTLAGGTLSLPTRPLLYLVALLLIERLAVKQAWLNLLSRRPTLTRWVVYAAVLLFTLTFAGSESSEFIYFEF